MMSSLPFHSHCYYYFARPMVPQIPPRPLNSKCSHHHHHHHHNSSLFFFYFNFPTIFPVIRFRDGSVVSSSFRLEAASSSSGAADYSEQWLDSKQKHKRQRIAGVEQDELLDPMALADPDSQFCEFRGVQIHYKQVFHHEEKEEEALRSQAPSGELTYQAKKVIGFPMILLHGFGASVYSWSRVLKPLAEATCSKVIAFDRPAFGLTSRQLRPNITPISNANKKDTDTQPLNPYSMAFSVLATVYFINLLAADKIILLGHSAGCLVAVNTYFEAPERVAALILVAPAIFAPISPQPPQLTKENHNKERVNQTPHDGSSNSNNVRENPFAKIEKILSKISTYIAQAITRMLKGMANMISSLYKKALTSILRSSFSVMLIRMVIDKFGIAAIKNAWYDANQITDHVLQAYTKPLKVKGWDRALVEFTVAMLTDSESESKPPLVKRLNEISCPVLVITGDRDRLVPSWNAKRLSQAIPGSCFEVIKDCGHLPQEEKVEDFISVVQRFLQKVVGAPDKQIQQAAAC
ncbi:hypothetical protein BVC80_8867g15 [Macleaya cordata]|uniref:AB hydrolase-1 domain-containing protein n=1 Tax=Macleaya cordata TaxID=56857 RepID=A0A200PTM3_MACCD|nr:hypothetical protein BVC80_8867g15 [Macleaya cordata]